MGISKVNQIKAHGNWINGYLSPQEIIEVEDRSNNI